MSLQIEIPSWGMAHARRVNMYDDIMGCMVKGFSFRVLGVFVRMVWRT